MARRVNTGKRPSLSANTYAGNSILAALLATEYKRLAPKLERVTLRRGQIVYRADQSIEEVYFPEDAVIAMINSTNDGRTVEVGMIGREGLVGINVFLGGIVTPDKAIVQLAGGAIRMKTMALRQELRFGGPLQRLLLDYARAFLAVISQSVACSQHHSIEQRVARLLLTTGDYAGSGGFFLAHKFIATLLGVRREGITVAAQKLQAATLIDYNRGQITVLDRKGLKRNSCECYRLIRQQYRVLQRKVPRLLSGS
jgi:CRP-like cAMP-binding protein